MSVYQSNRTSVHRARVKLAAQNRSPELKAAHGARLAKRNRDNPMFGKSNPFYGKKHSKKTKRLIAENTARQHAEEVFDVWPNRLELALRRLLTEANFTFTEQVQFGRCVVDAWISEYGLVFEADGEAWHTYNEQQNPGYHRRREWFLKQQPEIKAIVHLSEEDLSPWM